MFFFVLAVLFLLAAVICILIGKPDDSDFNGKVVGSAVGVVGVVLMLASLVRVVGATNVAVPTAFGSVKPCVGPGVHAVAPWTTLHKLSTRTQEYTMSSAAGEGAKNGDDSVPGLTSENLTVTLDETLLWHLDKTKCSSVFKKFGSIDSVVEKIIRPTSRTSTRDALGTHSAYQLTGANREQLRNEIETAIRHNFSGNGLIIDNFQIRDVKLPDSVRAEIEATATAQQARLRQKFENDKAREAADFSIEQARRNAAARIEEAKGLASAQQIIQSTLTPEYLQHEYIEAIKATKDSPNNTTVILPFDQKLTPLLNVK